MLEEWMALPVRVLFGTLGLAFGVTAAIVHLCCFAPGGRPRLASFVGVVPPFLGAPQLLFALTAVFLANDAWRLAEEALSAVRRERDEALTIQSLSGRRRAFASRWARRCGLTCSRW